MGAAVASESVSDWEALREEVLGLDWAILIRLRISSDVLYAVLRLCQGR